MKILIVTDAWEPQTNGVVRTLQAMERWLIMAGHTVRVVGPDPKRWWRFTLPFYKEITLEFFATPRLRRLFLAFQPDAVHIATEGPLGWDMRTLCLWKKIPFTTAYHTRFPEYVGAWMPRFLRPSVEAMAYYVLKHFHGPSVRIMAPTDSIVRTLEAHGFHRVVKWSRGVDTDLFKPYGKRFDPYQGFARPILLYVGRVSVEKNLKAFLDLSTQGTKVVVGSGPNLKKMSEAYPQVHFLGRMRQELLARAYAAADLFVFPSKTDTFGLVLLEACASGLRVAAYPVSGPVDVLGDESCRAFAVLDADLQKAVNRALALPDTVLLPRAFAEKHSWTNSAAQFYENLCILAPETLKNATES